MSVRAKSCISVGEAISGVWLVGVIVLASVGFAWRRCLRKSCISVGEAISGVRAQ